MDLNSHLAGIKETDNRIDANKNHNDKAFLFTSFSSMAKTLETVLGWPEGLIVPFNNRSDLLTKYEETPSPVIIISDDCALISDLAGEILNSFNRYFLVILSFSSKDILINQFKKNKIFPEFEDCLSEGMIIHHQLPCSVDEIKSFANLISIKKDALTIEQQQIINKITERIVDKYDADQRHSMENYMAADRILNGACRSGQYNLNDKSEWERAQNAYEVLIQSNSKWDNDRKLIELNNAIITLKKFKNKNIYVQTPQWHEPIKKVLIIDDETEMWKPVWNFIFGSDKIDVVGEANEGIDLIKCNNGDYDFVILDLNLGDNKPNGLSIIPYIKSIRFDLPIVVMTAYDSAEIAREAYKRGASFCFVKERRDRVDRKSTDYFNMLKRIFTSLPINSSIERKICKEFQKIEPSIDLDNSEACAELRRAVFYLLLEPTEICARKFLFGSSNEEWPRFQLIAKGCYDSFEIFIEKLLEEQQIPFNQFSNASEKYNLLRVNGHIIPEPNNLKLYHGIGHEIKEKQKPICLKDNVLQFFQDIIKYYEKYFEEKMILKYFEEKMEDNSPKLIIYDPPNENEKSHDERGKVGALRLLEGAYLCECGESQYDRNNIHSTTVDELIAEYDQLTMSLLKKEKPKYTGIFIDDKGIESGWKRALDILLPKSYIRYLEFTKSIECNEVIEAVGKADFAIVDLRLPKKNGTLSEDTGIDLLKSIVDKYPYLPIITLTASDDAFYFRQVMSIGAFDYFPKTEDTYFRSNRDEYFQAYYLQFMKIIEKLNHYLENIKPITLLLQRFNNFNHFKALDYLDISGPINVFGGGGSKDMSKSINSKVSSILQRSFFFLLGDQNISMNYLLRRLYRNNVKNSKWTMENHGFVEGIKASEYCLQILKTLYCEDQSYKYDKFSMGVLLDKDKKENTQQTFWSDNKVLHQDIKALWKTRNDISHKGIIVENPITLLQQAIENAVDVARSIDSKVRKDFVLKAGKPQWDLSLLLGRSFFRRVLGEASAKIFENIVEYYSAGGIIKNDFLEESINNNFRTLIKSTLEKSDKTEEAENVLKENITKWLMLFDNIPDKESLIEENKKLSTQLKALDDETQKLEDAHYAFMSKVPSARKQASSVRIAIDKETQEYEEKTAQIKIGGTNIKQQIEKNIIIIDSIKYNTQYYLDTRNEILDKWYYENISMKTHMGKKKLLGNYLEWNGIIDYSDFCYCFSDVFGSSMPALTNYCLSLIKFKNLILKEHSQKDNVKLIMKKLYEYLTIEDRANERAEIEWFVSYDKQKQVYYLKIDGISVPVNKEDLPEEMDIGKHKLIHWCDQDGFIRYEVMQ